MWINRHELEAERRLLWKETTESPSHQGYRTVDQNELLNECILNRSGECFIVHFYIEDSPVSSMLDDQLQDLSEAGHCTFLRINSRLAPFVTSRLRIKSDEPAVIAVRNGAIFGDVSLLIKGMWEIERVGLADA